jgi:hypothetical protein
LVIDFVATGVRAPFTLCRTSARGFSFLATNFVSNVKGIAMSHVENGDQTEALNPEDQAIRKNLFEIVRLLGREVARRLVQRTKAPVDGERQPANKIQDSTAK